MISSPTATSQTALAQSWPTVSVISVNYRQPELTRLMLDSLREVAYPALEIMLVDNSPEDKGLGELKADYPEALFIDSPSNLGFAGGNNLGIQQATGDYVLLLNNDTEVPNDFLHPMVEMMESDSSIGVVSPKIFFFDHPDILQYAGTTGIHPITSRGRKYGFGEKDRGQYDQPRETGYANGACMLIRQAALMSVGGEMYEDYFLYYEEHDLTERIRQAGYRILYQPKSLIYHKVSASTGAMSPLKTFYLHRNRLVFIRRTQQGVLKALAILYFFLIATPKALAKYWRQPRHRRAILKATWQALICDMRRWKG